MKESNLIPIGTEVELDTSKIKSRSPKNNTSNINKGIVYKVIDYKLTDGGGIGYIVKYKEEKLWVFSDEFGEGTKNSLLRNIKFDNSLNSINNSITTPSFTQNSQNNLIINGSSTLKKMVNPLYFIEWLIFSTKDIF